MGRQRFRESWSLRYGNSTLRIYRHADVTAEAAAGGVAPPVVRWKLEEWMRSSAGTLRSLYEALGGVWPWGLTSLERPSHELRVMNRLAEAFEAGELVALRDDAPRPAWHWPEEAARTPEEPQARPRPVPEPPAPTDEPAVDAAAQARSLREAARDGLPFCEECEKRRRQQQQQRAAA